jgi:hypothetical protein
MAAVTDKRKVEEKFKVTREVENGIKESLLVSGIWSRKFLHSKGFVKTERKLLVRLDGTRRE